MKLKDRQRANARLGRRMWFLCTRKGMTTRQAAEHLKISVSRGRRFFEQEYYRLVGKQEVAASYCSFLEKKSQPLSPLEKVRDEVEYYYARQSLGEFAKYTDPTKYDY